ncbi:S-adenosyl-L-methionine-dependent tRNA 4-demethylwyosine synthase [Desmophyllum pertusum]|uniref:S-adenosyl-L-methionine-dependent tRNA 4-demethylwyosine synthase TYW1 n=1 Tax=Desmophyllum pertusum TaxID=174260 RepID=A0A9X0D6U2_9CNID|nr:S-adenosyl-L-methionine-dependent tRNA 4-demethylwyosine synthase [Desmophyllum pertusum]
MFFFSRTIVLLVIFIAFHVDAHSPKADKEPNWQDKLINWWLSVRIPAASLIIGGLSLSWLITRLRGKDKFASEYAQRKSKQQERIRPLKESSSLVESETNSRGTARSEGLKIFFGTQTGKAKNLAEALQSEAQNLGLRSEVVDLKNYEPEDSLSEETDTCVFIVSTYVDGKPTGSTEWFYKWLEEASNDFRVQKSLLRGLDYAVFGLGDSLYEDRFNMVGKNVDKWLDLLSARRVFPFGMGDENVANSKHGGTEEDFKFWSSEVLSHIKDAREKSKKGSCQCSSESQSDGKGCCQDQEDLLENENQDDEIMYESTSEESSGDDEEENKAGLLDLEDLGPMMNTMKKAKEEKEARNGPKRIIGKKKKVHTEPKEMITPALEKALTKQGYRLIGSHSGVKLCRWTKSMLRGRGGCYKHTFYGIESHRCMETTPSLACANKCVFCWRHHTNPVGTEWKWKMDDPDMIVNGAMENHRNMIKQFRGVPGVKPERFEEGMKIRHCALSLVGEPIMYPKINDLIKILHGHDISTFLVTNAQFPDAIRNLLPVTQLYVSVDASTKDSLKKIDRPLFRDFWPRFLESLKALSEKGQRTVYRLTLVKSWNNEELQNYADLVSIGKPDFIEVKGVTYCGESKASTLTMANVPWHEEVIGFVQKLTDLLPDYDIACEHEHSNCLLIAHKKFKKDDGWYTWIDYPTFHQLLRSYEESNGAENFTALDYMAKTPDWSLMGHAQRGFDPLETRWHRKKKKDISGC